MEDVFNKLQGNRNNTLENLMRWMKEAIIIDISQAEAEQRVRKLFKEHVPDPRNVIFEGFKTIANKLAAEQKLPLEQFTSKLLNQGPALLKMSAKLIDASKEHEQKARALFKDAADIQRIELAKFKSVVTKLAEEQKKTFEEVSKQLAAEGPKLMNAALEGIKAFKSALEGK